MKLQRSYDSHNAENLKSEMSYFNIGNTAFHESFFFLIYTRILYFTFLIMNTQQYFETVTDTVLDYFVVMYAKLFD